MKRISQDDLERVALAKGAHVMDGDRSINAAHRRMLSHSMPPLKANGPDPAIMKALHDGSERDHQIARMIVTVAQQMKAQHDSLPTPIRQWNFDIVRDEDGFMQSIIATAVT